MCVCVCCCSRGAERSRHPTWKSWCCESGLPDKCSCIGPRQESGPARSCGCGHGPTSLRTCVSRTRTGDVVHASVRSSESSESVCYRASAMGNSMNAGSFFTKESSCCSFFKETLWYSGLHQIESWLDCRSVCKLKFNADLNSKYVSSHFLNIFKDLFYIFCYICIKIYSPVMIH